MCFFSWSWYTCGFSTRCHVAGCHSGVSLLADPLRVAGRTGSTPVPPLVLVVVSASEGWGGGSFFRAFGFPEVGAISFPDPFWRLSVPPLAGPEGQGCGALGCRGAAAGLLSAFPQHSSSSIVPIPMPSYSPTSFKGAALEEVTLGLIAKGAVELAPLPSPGFYSRLFVVWKTSGSWRPVIDLSHLNRFVDVSHFQMETIQSVLSVRQGDWMASIDIKEAYLQVPVHPASRLFYASSSGTTFISSSSMLWPLHGSAGLHQGHGSCFRHSPFYGDPHEALPRRLARPVSLSRIPRAGFADSPPPLSRVGDCRQSPEVQPRSITGCPVSRCDHRRPIFQGFSIARTRLQASVNSRRISILRLASRELMALAAGHSFFAGSPRSWRAFANAFSPALPPPVVGSSGSPGSGVGDSGLSPRPPVVASPSSPVLRGVSLPGVSRPSLLVRRLRRGLGFPSRPSGRFRPVGHASGGVVNHRQGTVGRSAGSSPVPVISTR